MARSITIKMRDENGEEITETYSIETWCFENLNCDYCSGKKQICPDCGSNDLVITANRSMILKHGIFYTMECKCGWYC